MCQTARPESVKSFHIDTYLAQGDKSFLCPNSPRIACERDITSGTWGPFLPYPKRQESEIYTLPLRIALLIALLGVMSLSVHNLLTVQIYLQ